MKVGILTFHRAKNYGAVLQCYALQAYINSLSFNVEVIDYFPEYFKAQDKILPFAKMKGKNFKGKVFEMYSFFATLFPVITKRRAFNKFLLSLPLSVSQYDETGFSSEGYDVIIVGSDQVWNTDITHGIDQYFAGLFPHKGTKLVSYAASTMHAKEDGTKQYYYEQIISHFDRLSVRETRLNDYLNSLKPHVSVCVADPVLLLSKEQWKEMSIMPKEKGYLLVYTVPEDPRVMLLAGKIAKRRGLKIVQLVAKIAPRRKGLCRQCVSPQQFVGYFQNADYVVTTSFHGTAFSILFQRQFCTLMLGSPVDERARGLLQKVGLASQAVEANILRVPTDDINYSKVEESLNKYLQVSKSYLDEILIK